MQHIKQGTTLHGKLSFRILPCHLRETLILNRHSRHVQDMRRHNLCRTKICGKGLDTCGIAKVCLTKLHLCKNLRLNRHKHILAAKILRYDSVILLPCVPAQKGTAYIRRSPQKQKYISHQITPASILARETRFPSVFRIVALMITCRTLSCFSTIFPVMVSVSPTKTGCRKSV